MTYEAPFLSSHLEEIGLFPVWLQQRFLRVVAELRLFNQQVDIVRGALNGHFFRESTSSQPRQSQQTLKKATESR